MLDQKCWYLSHQSEFKKLTGKWIGLCKNTLVFSTDYDLLSNELEKFRGTEIKPLVILVGSEERDPTTNIYIHSDEFRKFESDEELPCEKMDGALSFQSIAHPREYQEDPMFRTECRYQTQEMNGMYQRPILSTLVNGKIVSFLISPCSSFTFLSKRSIKNIGFHDRQPHYDLWGGITYVGKMFGQQALFRLSKDNYEDVNILGYDIIKQHKLVFSKNQPPKWDSIE